ncbi:hypothetical protein EVAR_68178_1 [Eumeta japonica]|uniref:Uncharacterized protein n=1 Tax=Eumeta variegata TaxID=151549 RepID=A0A4C1ZYM2_EUMVA|nr:hypothetical protein EVAR_68178_1 [Eumeta japonica]
MSGVEVPNSKARIRFSATYPKCNRSEFNCVYCNTSGTDAGAARKLLPRSHPALREASVGASDAKQIRRTYEYAPGGRPAARKLSHLHMKAITPRYGKFNLFSEYITPVPRSDGLISAGSAAGPPRRETKPHLRLKRTYTYTHRHISLPLRVRAPKEDKPSCHHVTLRHAIRDHALIQTTTRAAEGTQHYIFLVTLRSSSRDTKPARLEPARRNSAGGRHTTMRALAINYMNDKNQTVSGRTYAGRAGRRAPGLSRRLRLRANAEEVLRWGIKGFSVTLTMRYSELENFEIF